MNKTKKIPAFTLAELIIVLIVSSIVIAMTFLVLQMVRKQVNLIQQNYSKKQEVRIFESRLLRDFTTYSSTFNSKENSLLLRNSKDSILYQFKNNYITRQKDTFNLEVANINVYLEGEKANNNAIDAIEIEFSSNFSNAKLFMHQVKDASYYLNE